MPELFPFFPVGNGPYNKMNCKTCNHRKSDHKNDKEKLFKTTSKPCSKLGCDCKAYNF